MNRRRSSKPYSGSNVPPCIALLDNSNPIIKDRQMVYRNMNRIFCFLSTSPKPSSGSGSSFKPQTSTNLQISLTTYIIGLYIDQIQQGALKYEEGTAIHSDKTANAFIHQAIKKSPQLELDYIPKLSLVYSNGNAILPLISTVQEITPLNYYILLVLDRLENNPGLFFGNNSFTTEDPINCILASLSIKLPL